MKRSKFSDQQIAFLLRQAEEGRQLSNKTPKRKVSAELREDRCVASPPNEVWAMDFMSYPLFDGRRIRILTIVDAFSRLSPAIDVRQSCRGSDVVKTLEWALGCTASPGLYECAIVQGSSARRWISGPV